jgi:hypothetical protein
MGRGGEEREACDLAQLVNRYRSSVRTSSPLSGLLPSRRNLVLVPSSELSHFRRAVKLNPCGGTQHMHRNHQTSNSGSSDPRDSIMIMEIFHPRPQAFISKGLVHA